MTLGVIGGVGVMASISSPATGVGSKDEAGSFAEAMGGIASQSVGGDGSTIPTVVGAGVTETCCEVKETKGSGIVAKTCNGAVAKGKVGMGGKGSKHEGSKSTVAVAGVGAQESGSAGTEAMVAGGVALRALPPDASVVKATPGVADGVKPSVNGDAPPVSLAAAVPVAGITSAPANAPIPMEAFVAVKSEGIAADLTAVSGAAVVPVASSSEMKVQEKVGVEASSGTKVAERSDVGDLKVHAYEAATPNKLEVGVQGGTVGWMKVSAEVAGNGCVSATLRGFSVGTTQMLQAQAPKIESYLCMQGVVVRSVKVDTMPLSAWSGSVLMGGGTTSGGGQAQGQERNRTYGGAMREMEEYEDFAEQASVVWSGMSVAGVGSWLSVRV